MEDGVSLEVVFGSVSNNDLELVLEMVVNEAVEEVMNCTNLQPSVPGIVCEVISDIVQSVSEVDVASVADAPDGNSADSDQLNMESVPCNEQVC